MPDIDIYQTLPPHAQGTNVYEHLTRYGVEIADSPPLRFIVTRATYLALRDATRLSELWQTLDPAKWRPLIEAALDIDLTAISDRAVRLVSYYCLTALTPGRTEARSTDFTHALIQHYITRSIRALQRGGEIAMVVALLEEAADLAEL